MKCDVCGKEIKAPEPLLHVMLMADAVACSKPCQEELLRQLHGIVEESEEV